MACAAPTATELNRQKPQPPATGSKPSTHAWWPGGRTRQKDIGGASGGSARNAPTARSTAAMTAPAARVVARHEPEETVVMPNGLFCGKMRSTSTGESGRGSAWAPDS